MISCALSASPFAANSARVVSLLVNVSVTVSRLLVTETVGFPEAVGFGAGEGALVVEPPCVGLLPDDEWAVVPPAGRLV